MDEDEVAQLVQAQMDGEEWFGSMSYASSHLPTATNAPVAHLRTAKAWTDVMLTASDSSGEEDDEADLGDDTSTSSGFSEGSLGHVGISKPPTTTIPIEKIEKDEITSLPSPSTRSSPTFVVASRSSRGLRTSSPLISSARAKTADSDASNDLEPPPLLSSVLPATIEADLASTTASDKPEEDAPPRLPDVPDLPVLRAPSYVFTP